ncbi:hypothetical protein GGI25_005618 [Coemansia spiralis]|uniref:N-acetyltransferase domain-containing protein n=1 Tax=Coemansia spiralis TaxID=417178 RepID=A0A9W8G4C4_9FUNG|nr:hypothetical protein GGI25_005618 [Coemansia spiralis]
MAKRFKYDLDALEWDDEHKCNKEATYCYCGMDYNEDETMLRCAECKQLFHWDCVNCLKTKPLKGDSFYRFKCNVCSDSGEEEYERDTLSWVQVIYLTLYHLIKTQPDKKYFRWRENICATVGEHWEGLFPDKSKTATWQNTVAGCLSTHNVLFKSGFDDTQQTGNWTLHQAVEPSKVQFKGPTKARDMDKSAVKRERTRKNTEKTARPTENVTDAEKEILEVLNESKAAAKNRRGTVRHRVSFSDDEDETGGNGNASKRARSKRRQGATKALEMDTDLMQSFELYTRLEKQRLGQQDSPSASETPTESTQAKDAVVPASETKDSKPVTEPSISLSETKNADIAEALDGYYLEDDVKSISSLSSWTTDSELEDILSSSNEEDEKSAKALVTDLEAEELHPNADSQSANLQQQRQKTHPVDETMEADGNGESGDRVESDISATRLQLTEESKKGTVESKALTTLGWTHLGKEPHELLATQADFSMGKSPQMMDERAQWDVYARVGMSKAALGKAAARRLQRRLQLRRFKRMLGLQVFDIDEAVKKCMRRRQRVWRAREIDKRVADIVGEREELLSTGEIGQNGEHGQQQRGCQEMAGASAEPLIQDNAQQRNGDMGDGDADSKEGNVMKVTPYEHSFASRLLGRAVLRESLTFAVARVSPYHGRLLRPYIWRDWIQQPDKKSAETAETAETMAGPAMLWVLRDIRLRQHRIFDKLRLAEDVETHQAASESIDYVYFQAEHVEQVNEVLRRTFWEGVDVKEALMYPEFTVVALYRRVVVGCAFLTPDAYLTYIAVRAGWEGAGLAKFMLYHLTQTVPTKDITLHVSANNLAMILYQQFGFKAEKYVVDFYKAYLPESSRQNRNAFFMRLRRH